MPRGGSRHKVDRVPGQCAIPLCVNGYGCKAKKQSQVDCLSKPLLASYYTFPDKNSNIALRQEWVDNVKIAHLQTHDINSGTRICNLHFNTECFDYSGLTHERLLPGLKKKAVPTQFDVNIAWEVPGCPFITDKLVTVLRTSEPGLEGHSNRGIVFQHLDIHNVSDSGSYTTNESSRHFSDFRNEDMTEVSESSQSEVQRDLNSISDHTYSSAHVDDSLPQDTIDVLRTTASDEVGDLSVNDSQHPKGEHAYGKDPSLCSAKPFKRTRKNVKEIEHRAFLCSACNRICPSLQGIALHLRSKCKRQELPNRSMNFTLLKKAASSKVCQQICYIPFHCSVCLAIFKTKGTFEAHTGSPKSACHSAVCQPSKLCENCEATGQESTKPKNLPQQRFLPSHFQKKIKQNSKPLSAQKELVCYFCELKLPYTAKIVHKCSTIKHKQQIKPHRRSFLGKIRPRHRKRDTSQENIPCSLTAPNDSTHHIEQQEPSESHTRQSDNPSGSGNCSSQSISSAHSVKSPPLVRRELFGDEGIVFTDADHCTAEQRPDDAFIPYESGIHPVDRLDSPSLSNISWPLASSNIEQCPVEQFTSFQLEMSSDEEDECQKSQVKLETGDADSSPDWAELMRNYVIMKREEAGQSEDTIDSGDIQDVNPNGSTQAQLHSAGLAHVYELESIESHETSCRTNDPPEGDSSQIFELGVCLNSKNTNSKVGAEPVSDTHSAENSTKLRDVIERGLDATKSQRSTASRESSTKVEDTSNAHESTDLPNQLVNQPGDDFSSTEMMDTIMPDTKRGSENGTKSPAVIECGLDATKSQQSTASRGSSLKVQETLNTQESTYLPNQLVNESGDDFSSAEMLDTTVSYTDIGSPPNVTMTVNPSEKTVIVSPKLSVTSKSDVAFTGYTLLGSTLSPDSGCSERPTNAMDGFREDHVISVKQVNGSIGNKAQDSNLMESESLASKSDILTKSVTTLDDSSETTGCDMTQSLYSPISSDSSLANDNITTVDDTSVTTGCNMYQTLYSPISSGSSVLDETLQSDKESGECTDDEIPWQTLKKGSIHGRDKCWPQSQQTVSTHLNTSAEPTDNIGRKKCSQTKTEITDQTEQNDFPEVCFDESVQICENISLQEISTDEHAPDHNMPQLASSKDDDTHHSSVSTTPQRGGSSGSNGEVISDKSIQDTRAENEYLEEFSFDEVIGRGDGHGNNQSMMEIPKTTTQEGSKQRRRESWSSTYENNVQLSEDMENETFSRCDTPKTHQDANGHEGDSIGELGNESPSSEVNVMFMKSTHSCGECQKSFSDKHTLNVHVIEAHRPAILKCDICQKSFTNTVGYKNHMHHKHGMTAVKEEPDKNQEGETMSQKDKLAPMGTKYHCKLCKKLFGSPSGLNKHMQNKHSSRNTLSENQETRRAASTEESHPGGTKFHCDSCKKFFGSSKGLKNHIHYKHNPALMSKNTKDAVTTNPRKGEEFHCDACNKVFGSSRGLKNHIHYKHNPALNRRANSSGHTEKRKQLSCPICGKRFLHAMGLKVHLHFRHKQNIREVFRNAHRLEAVNPFVDLCEMNIGMDCGPVNVQDAKLMHKLCKNPCIDKRRGGQTEISSSAKFQLFPGVYVQEPRPSSAFEVNMTRAGTQKRPEGDAKTTQKKCHLCSREFGYTKGLSRHMLSAHRIKYKVMKKFERIFIQSAKVSPQDERNRNSVEASSSETLNPSAQVAKKLKRRPKEDMHNETNEEDLFVMIGNSFKCRRCPRKFVSSGRFQQHLKIVHEGTSLPFRCDNCLKSFFRYSSLRRHKKTCKPSNDTNMPERIEEPQEEKSHSSSYDSMIECIACDCCFQSAAAFVTHFNEMHTPKTPSGTSSTQNSHGDQNSVCSQSSFAKNVGVAKEITQESQENITKPYVCPVCDQGFPTVTSVNSHYESCHVNEANKDEKRKRSSDEDVGFSAKQTKRPKTGLVPKKSDGAAISQGLDEKTYSCLVCSKSFSTMTSVESHYEMAHIKSTAKPSGAKSSTKRLQPNKVKRAKMISKPEEVLCPMCGDRFPSVIDVEVHCEEVHFNSRRKSGRQIRMPIGGKFICTMCDKAFCDSKSLDVHCQVHHSEKPSSVVEENAANPSQIDAKSDGEENESSDADESIELDSNESDTENSSEEDRQKKARNAIPMATKFKVMVDNLICLKCETQFLKLSYLEVHMRKLHQDTKLPYICGICGIGCLSTHSLEKHMHFKHESRQNTCQKCKMCFATKVKLRVHMKKKHASGITQKVTTESTAASAKAKKNQKPLNTSHTSSSKLSSEEMQMISNKKCPKCRSKFCSMDSLERHYTLLHKDFTMPHKCTKCTRHFLTEQRLENHCSKMHANSESIEAKTKVSCQWCTLTFSNIHNMERHAKQKHKEHGCIYVCDKCGKAYHTEAMLKKCSHKLSVEARAIITGKSQDSTPAEQTNTQVDISEKSEDDVGDVVEDDVCPVCRQEYPTSKEMIEHFECDHPDADKPYTCTLCQKGFVLENACRNHFKRFHNIEVVYRLERNYSLNNKPEDPRKSNLKCFKCPKTFKLSHDMITHFKSTHKLEWFASFIQCKQSPLHFNVTEPYECKYCTRMFTESSSLDVHQLMEHTKSPDAVVSPVAQGKKNERGGAFSDELWRSMRQPSADKSGTSKFGEEQSNTRSTSADDACEIVDFSPPKISTASNTNTMSKGRKYHIVQIPLKLAVPVDPKTRTLIVSGSERTEASTSKTLLSKASIMSPRTETRQENRTTWTTVTPVSARRIVMNSPPSEHLPVSSNSAKPTAPLPQTSPVPRKVSILKLPKQSGSGKPVIQKLPKPSGPGISVIRKLQQRLQHDSQQPITTSPSTPTKSSSSENHDDKIKFDHAVSLNCCPSCGKHFSALSELEYHFIKKHDVRKMRHRCSTCNIGFLTPAGLCTHNAEVHRVQSMPHQCKICSKGFLTGPGLDNHMKILHPSAGTMSKRSSGVFSHTPGISPVSGKGSQVQAAIIASKKSSAKAARRGSARPLDDEEDDDDGSFSCLSCDRTFLTIDGAETHARFTHGNSSMPFRCTTCNLGFLEQCRLDRHLSRFHSAP